VTIYQCVTLGGTSPESGVGGKRHPTLMDGVIIGSGAQVLGPITVGERGRVGANSVVTKDVPAGATMVGIPARQTLVDAADYQKGFVPYGTPCSERFDPATQQLEILKCEMEQLQKRLTALDEAKAAPKSANRAKRA
jgi:serine O-acetyltransferase